jgi:hypothetical protein
MQKKQCSSLVAVDSIAGLHESYMDVKLHVNVEIFRFLMHEVKAPNTFLNSLSSERENEISSLYSTQVKVKVKFLHSTQSHSIPDFLTLQLCMKSHYKHYTWYCKVTKWIIDGFQANSQKTFKLNLKFIFATSS